MDLISLEARFYKLINIYCQKALCIRAERLTEEIDMDIKGQLSTPTWGGRKYPLIFVDDHLHSS